MILLLALLDAVGVASIMPFIAVLTSPNIIENNDFINTLFNYSSIFGVKTNEQFLFSLGVVFSFGVFIIIQSHINFFTVTFWIHVSVWSK